MPLLEPPSSYLPPIRTLVTCSAENITTCLFYLRLLYNPEVRGTRRRRFQLNSHDNVGILELEKPNGGEPKHDASLSSEDDIIAELRTDTFERSYAIRWLTRLISQAEQWETEHESTENPSTTEDRSQLLHDAAALLAVCAGTSAAGIINRTFLFTPVDSLEPIRVQLRDIPLANQDYRSMGAQTWGGAFVLAEAIVDDPESFGLRPDTSEKRLRVLELGAGTGLVSLALGKLLESKKQGAEIIATDFYDSVLGNLDENIRANFPHTTSSHSESGPSSSVLISAHRLDWSTFPHSAPASPLDAPFDLIFGADVVYEAQHASWLKPCVANLLRRPDEASAGGGPDPRFHLVIPLREKHEEESGSVESVFAPDPSRRQVGEKELVVVSKELIECDAESGRVDEVVEYAYYNIGWA